VTRLPTAPATFTGGKLAERPSEGTQPEEPSPKQPKDLDPQVLTISLVHQGIWIGGLGQAARPTGQSVVILVGLPWRRSSVDVTPLKPPARLQFGRGTDHVRVF